MSHGNGKDCTAKLCPGGLKVTAFERWFQSKYQTLPLKGAEYLYWCCTKGPADSIAWEYLKRVGDKHYSLETFVKAARLILEVEDETND